MRKLLLVGLMVISTHGMTAKCVVDGKIVYKNPPCPEGRIPMVETPMSNVNSAGLREEVKKYQQAEYLKKAEEARLRESYRELARMPGEKGRQAREDLQSQGKWTVEDDLNLQRNRQKQAPIRIRY